MQRARRSHRRRVPQGRPRRPRPARRPSRAAACESDACPGRSPAADRDGIPARAPPRPRPTPRGPPSHRGQRARRRASHARRAAARLEAEGRTTWPISNSDTPVVAVGCVVRDRLEQTGQQRGAQHRLFRRERVRDRDARRREPGATEVARREERVRHGLGRTPSPTITCRSRRRSCCIALSPPGCGDLGTVCTIRA